QYLRSRYRAGRDRADQVVGRTACAAMRAARRSLRCCECQSSRPGEPGAGGMAMTAHEMIVHHTDRLHEGIDDCRSTEFETAARELLGHFLGYSGFGGDLFFGSLAVWFWLFL